MNQIMNEYLQYLQDVKQVSDNTKMSYKNDLERFTHFMEEQNITGFDKVNETVANSYILYLEREQLSPATVLRNIAVLRSFFLYLMKKHMIEIDPTERIHGPKVEKKKPEVLTMDEVEEFLKLPDTSLPKGLRDKAMFELMYATGMKVSELIHLNYSDINLNYSILECHSEKKQRLIPFGKTAAQALNQYLEHGRPYFSGNDKTDYLFINSKGTQLSRQGFFKILKGYAKQLGLEHSISPQVLRNSFAAHLIENGANVRAVGEMLGYTDLASAYHYVNTSHAKVMEEYKNAHPRA